MYSNNAMTTSSSLTRSGSTSHLSRSMSGNMMAVDQPPAVDTSVSQDPSLVALEKARVTVQSQLKLDESTAVELENIMNAASSHYTNTPNEAWLPFRTAKFVQLPKHILDEYSVNPSHCGMGLFTEIDRTWITMDNKLYLWDYTHGTDYILYDEQPNIINGIALVRAKPGVFVDNISHVLVICTPTTVSLLGVSAPPSQPSSSGEPVRRELTLYATDIEVDTDNRPMTSVVGTLDGRIFMCDQGGGALYELTYQAKETWFSKRANLINHSVGTAGALIPSILAPRVTDRIVKLALDDSRRCLYALTADYHIVLYHLPKSQPTTVTKVSVIDHLAAKAQSLCPGSPLLDSRELKIESIHVLDSDDSKNVHLMAIALSGVRLYFTHKRGGLRGYGYQQPTVAGDTAPSNLMLIHVRTPPTGLLHPDDEANAMNLQGGFSQAPPNWPIDKVGISSYKNGLLVAAQSLQEGGFDSDLLLCAAPDLPKIAGMTSPDVAPPQNNAYAPKPVLTEIASLLPVQGYVWDIKPNPAAYENGQTTAMGWNETASQFSGPPQSFLVLTNSGLSVVVRKRPVDTALELLENFFRTGDNIPFDEFMHTYGPQQTLAMALAIASGNSWLSSNSVVFSSVPQPLNSTAAALTVNPVAVQVMDAAKHVFWEYGGKPVIVEQRLYGGFEHVTKFSTRHDGLALYLARLLRPLWKARITTGTQTQQTSNVSENVLQSIQRDLMTLRNFLDSNPQFFLPGTAEYGFRGGATDQEAWKAENASATQLQILLNQSIEAISFVLLLKDLGLPTSISKMDPSVQQGLFGLTYEALLTTKEGREIARSLVNGIINQQISQQLSVDAISEVLQQKCGSFCSADDVMLYKAIEQVRKAKELPDTRERLSALEQSLRLFEKGARNMTISKLQNICQDYRELRYSHGIVALSLKCAQEWDTDSLGQAYFEAGLPAGDPRAQSLEKRKECYQCIVDALSWYEDGVRQAGTNTELAEELDAAYNRIVDVALLSQDFVFHSYLYDWLSNTRDHTYLLELESPFIEVYLRHEPQSLEKIELLWQFYVQNGNSLKAAQTLAELADSTQFGLLLEKRLEYLSLAVGNAKSNSATSVGRHEAVGEFLTDLEEKLEVANVQLEIYAYLCNQPQSQQRDEALQALGSALMDISQLYRDYADRFNILEMKLLIFHTSEHRDPAMVTAVWREIINRHLGDSDPFHRLGGVVSELGRRFYPSEIAFPIDILSELLETHALQNRDSAPPGWALRVLVEGNFPHEVVLDYFHRLKESGVPPFQDPGAVRHILYDITVFISEWLDEILRPGSRYAKSAFPADKVDQLVTRYLTSLQSSATAGGDVTRRKLTEIQSKIRNRF